jgi:AraC-like DNA-binding protein
MASRPFRMLRCALPGVEAVEASTGHTFPRRTHDQFGIGWMERGAQRSASGRGPVEAGPGCTITVNPGEVHDGVPIGDAGRSWRILYIEPTCVAEVVRDISEDRSDEAEFALPVIEDERVARRVRALFASLTRQDREPLHAQERLWLLLASVLQTGGSRPPVPPAISRAQALVDDDPATALTLADLARASGLSRFQVLRGFAQATGLTPHAYLVQRRVQGARRFIADGRSLAEAALASGFADQSHMTRAFVRVFGITPGAYAEAVR